MPTYMAVAGLTAAFMTLAVLLLSLNFASIWKWWVKAGAIVVTTGFFAVSYFSMNTMLGWPASAPLPERFELLWAKVEEPDRTRSFPGAIYLWVDALDANNVPSGRPRAHEIPYTDDLAKSVRGAQKERGQGKEISGTVESGEELDEVADKATRLVETDEGNSRAETVPFMDEHLQITFQELAPVVLPDKGPL